MRIAIAGKGGSGKTTIAATAARLLARSGRAVVALDADSNPNLAVALGADSATTHALPTSLQARQFGGTALVESLEAIVADHAVPAPEGISLLLMGMPEHAGEGCLCAAHATVRGLLADAEPGTEEAPERVVVVDMEASPEHLGRSTAAHVDVLLLVAEPYYRSLETVRRLATLAAELPIPRISIVANKVRAPVDADAIWEFCERHDLELVGEVPWSEAVTDADRARLPLVDSDDAGYVVAAVQAVLDRLDV